MTAVSGVSAGDLARYVSSRFETFCDLMSPSRHAWLQRHTALLSRCAYHGSHRTRRGVRRCGSLHLTACKAVHVSARMHRCSVHPSKMTSTPVSLPEIHRRAARLTVATLTTAPALPRVGTNASLGPPGRTPTPAPAPSTFEACSRLASKACSRPGEGMIRELRTALISRGLARLNEHDVGARDRHDAVRLGARRYGPLGHAALRR